MKRKALSLLLVTAVVLSFALAAAPTIEASDAQQHPHSENTTHCSCGQAIGSAAITGHTHEASAPTWEAFPGIDSTGKLAESVTDGGHYYLTGNLNGVDNSGTSAYTDPSILWPSDAKKSVTLCLNGYTVNAKLVIDGGAIVTLCDCSSTPGTVTSAASASGMHGGCVQIKNGTLNLHSVSIVYTGTASNRSGCVSAAAGCTFNMYSGMLDSGNNGGIQYGSAIYAVGSSSSQTYITLYGGTVKGDSVTNNGGSVYIGNYATFTMEGGTIEGGSAPTGSNKGNSIYGTGSATLNFEGGKIISSASAGNTVATYNKIALSLNITDMSLAVNEDGAVGVGYTAEFAASDTCKALMPSTGYKYGIHVAADIDGGLSGVNGYEDTEMKNVTVHVTNILNSDSKDADDAKIPVVGSAFVKLGGTTVQSAPKGFTMKAMLEAMDAQFGNPDNTETYSESALLLLATVYDRFGRGYMDTHSWAFEFAVRKADALNAGTPEPDAETNAQILAQRRQQVIDTMRESLTVLWRLDDDLVYSKAGPSQGLDADEINNSENIVHLVGGRVYQGLPYSHGACSTGSFLSYSTNQDSNGVYTIAGLTSTSLNGNPNNAAPNIARIGNDCSSTLYWAWGQISTTVLYSPTKNMTENNGYLKVGSYTAPADIYTNTKQTAAENGTDTMYAAYAQLQPGDAVVMYVSGSGGHAMMVTEVHIDPSNPANSYVLVMDQGMTPYKNNEHYYNEEIGEEVYLWGRVDEKFTFQRLYNLGYLPVTCKELNDPAPLRKLVVKDSITTPTADNMFQGVITSTYGMSSVTVTITDSSDQPVQEMILFSLHTAVKEFHLDRIANEMASGVTNGTIDLSALPEGTYRCTYTCQMSTGEQITVRDFSITVDGQAQEEIAAQEVYYAPEENVLALISEQQPAASWHITGILSISIDLLEESV